MFNYARTSFNNPLAALRQTPHQGGFIKIQCLVIPIILLVILLTDNLSSASLLHDGQLDDKEAAKTANINEAERINEPNDITNDNRKRTVEAVNQIPGVKVTEKDLEPPDLPPIKGFHPIKKLLRPVENLEGMSIKLEQQIMKLEGPIAALQPPMLNLQNKMTVTNQQISQMQTSLESMHNEVQRVRIDITGMRKEISELKQPITDLREPLGNVASPLKAVQGQLNLILLAILLTAIIIAIGTPIAAIQIYRNRHKIFTDLKDQELPK